MKSLLDSSLPKARQDLIALNLFGKKFLNEIRGISNFKRDFQVGISLFCEFAEKEFKISLITNEITGNVRFQEQNFDNFENQENNPLAIVVIEDTKSYKAEANDISESHNSVWFVIIDSNDKSILSCYSETKEVSFDLFCKMINTQIGLLEMEYSYLSRESKWLGVFYSKPEDPISEEFIGGLPLGIVKCHEQPFNIYSFFSFVLINSVGKSWTYEDEIELYKNLMEKSKSVFMIRMNEKETDKLIHKVELKDIGYYYVINLQRKDHDLNRKICALVHSLIYEEILVNRFVNPEYFFWGGELETKIFNEESRNTVTVYNTFEKLLAFDRDVALSSQFKEFKSKLDDIMMQKIAEIK